MLKATLLAANFSSMNHGLYEFSFTTVFQRRYCPEEDKTLTVAQGAFA